MEEEQEQREGLPNGAPTIYADGRAIAYRVRDTEGEMFSPTAELERVQVSLPAENEGDRIPCKHCPESVAHYAEGWVHENTGDALALDESHNAEPGPVGPEGWCNSAAITFEGPRGEGYSAVYVNISVGDPRGSFAMGVLRGPDGDLRLSVPHPSDGAPHMKLTEIRPGLYSIS